MNVVVLVGLVVTVLTALPVALQLRGHPKGLYILFFTELWERFSFYGMRALLIYYLTQHFLFDDRIASGQVAAYATLIYLLPVVGGVIADRYLGNRKAVTIGALLLVFGHFGLALEGRPAQQVLTYHGRSYDVLTRGKGQDRRAQLSVGGRVYDLATTDKGVLSLRGLPATAPLPALLAQGDYAMNVKPREPVALSVFYLALSLIIVGVGFLKANLSSMVGQLYPDRDPRRDAGFTLYYYGINLGSFWAAIVCGALGEAVGWWAGFGLAGLGMLAGYVVFLLGGGLLQGKGLPPAPERLSRRIAGPLTLEGAVRLGVLPMLAFIWLLLQHNVLVGYLLSAVSIAILGYIAWYMARRCDRAARQKLGLALVLIAGSVVYWTLEEQANTSLSLFADRNTRLPAHGFFAMTAAQTQSLEPGMLLLFAPVFAAVWAWLGRRGRDPDPLFKFALSLVQVGLGFIVLVVGAHYADASFRVPLIFLALCNLLLATGELSLSPVGMSEVTKLAPPLLISTLMAVWFLAISWGEWIGGLVAKMTSTATIGGVVVDPRLGLSIVTHVFSLIGWTSVGCGVLFLGLSPLLKSWANGADDTDTVVGHREPALGA